MFFRRLPEAWRQITTLLLYSWLTNFWQIVKPLSCTFKRLWKKRRVAWTPGKIHVSSFRHPFIPFFFFMFAFLSWIFLGFSLYLMPLIVRSQPGVMTFKRCKIAAFGHMYFAYAFISIQITAPTDGHWAWWWPKLCWFFRTYPLSASHYLWVTYYIEQIFQLFS